MPIKTQVAAFNEHLNGIQKARPLADEAITCLAPASLHASKAVNIAWEATFDLICQHRKKLTLKKIKEFAEVFYKLGQCYRQVQSSAQRDIEFAELRARLQVVTQGLPQELREEFEREFKLLG